MGQVQTFRSAWNHFWFRNVPPHSLAAFRILFGLYLLAYFLAFAPNVELLFSNHGVYAPYLLPDLGLPVFWAWLLYLFTLLVIFGFTLGYKTLFLTPLVLLLYFYYFTLNFATNNTSFDRLNLILLVILCFARLDGAWALGKRAVPGKGREPGVSIWAIRLITIQMSFLYFGAGFWKLISPYWHTGEMMHWTLIGPWGTPLAFSFVRLNPPAGLFTLLTWSVILLELTMPLMLFNKRLQVYAFAAGFLFHLSIAVLLNIPEFMNCVCAYVLFVNPAMVQRYGNALFQNLGKVFTRLAHE
ncbi:HTTM domain protein [Pedosphaera parvula Ellin514]|uniref:HTTM domain protein n=2 Tax=Pedosphaera TaxID=1032526 RepID=B9XHH1_PEDPL|nr:HTTM domain protein [Pedosphaera parvula Ellin514]